MSKKLEDNTDEDLIKELVRRNQLRLEGRCAYCKSPLIVIDKQIHYLDKVSNEVELHDCQHAEYENKKYEENLIHRKNYK